MRDWSDPIFDQVFAVVDAATRQLAETEQFSFPGPEEDPLVPLQVPITAGFNAGLGIRPCKSLQPKTETETPSEKPKKVRSRSGRNNF